MYIFAFDTNYYTTHYEIKEKSCKLLEERQKKGNSAASNYQVQTERVFKRNDDDDDDQSILCGFVKREKNDVNSLTFCCISKPEDN